MKKVLTFLSIVMAIAITQVWGQMGSITNIAVQQRTDGSGLLDIFFDLDGDAKGYNIFVEVSFDDGLVYHPLPSEFLSGATAKVSSGIQHHIIWDGYSSVPGQYSEESRVKIIALKAIGIGTPCPGMPYFTDERDGQKYNTVLINDQCWMKENLNYATANSWCFEDNPAYCESYGRLYSWDGVMHYLVGSGLRGVCPVGWHVPSDQEWDKLASFIEEIQGNHYDIIGNMLKSCRQMGSPLGGGCDTDEHPRWQMAGVLDPDKDDEPYVFQYGTDDYGFSALPGGARGYTGLWFDLGTTGAWWTATESTSTTARRWQIASYTGALESHSPYKDNGFSLRCVKD